MSVVALNSWLSTWLLTTSVEDFERASIRKEDNSNTTCELTILILSVSATFSVTFVWLLPCYIFHAKSVSTTSTIRPIRVFVLQGNAAAKSGILAVFILRFSADIWCPTCQTIIKIGQQLPKLHKCYSGTLFDLQFHVHDAPSLSYNLTIVYRPFWCLIV